VGDDMDIDELPFTEFLKALRENDLDEDADTIEVQIREIMTEIGYTKEQVDATPHRELLEVIKFYGDTLKEQIGIAKSMESFPTMGVSMNGRWMAGKDVPDDVVKHVMMIQAEKMEREKARLGHLG